MFENILLTMQCIAIIIATYPRDYRLIKNIYKKALLKNL